MRSAEERGRRCASSFRMVSVITTKEIPGVESRKLSRASMSSVLEGPGRRSQSAKDTWPCSTLHWISSHAVFKPPFASTTTFESASSAEKAREAANEPEPSIRVVLCSKRKERTREAPPLGLGYDVGMIKKERVRQSSNFLAR